MFSDPTIDGLLRDNFIEARLHTDGADGPRKTRNHDLQEQFATSVANPWLVVVDPKTETRQAESGFQNEEAMTDFLTEASAN